jgi:ribose 5-phosphate isomerase B
MDNQLSPQKNLTIYFATDHAGFELKNTLLAFVRDELGFDVVDCGAHEFNSDDDYPDTIGLAAQAVSEDSVNRKGIVFGGSGQGEAIVANKYSGVRAAVYYGSQPSIVSLSREHNDANILSLGARFLTQEEAKEAVRVWLTTDFSRDPRHVRRIEKIPS